MICIYCKNEITDGLISDEHIFPKSFGCPDSWVLNCVCKICNNKFGRSIDQWLAGDSLEGVRRLKDLGSRSGSILQPRRLRLTIPKEPKFGYFQGAIVYPDYKTVNSIVLANQAGFLNAQNVREFFAREDIPHTLEKINSLRKKDIRILAESPKAHDDMVKFLISQKIIPKYDIKETFGPRELDLKKPITIEVIGTVDNEIKRAIAKIAFNFLAKVRGNNFALKSCFNEIRAYINGESKDNKFVSLIDEPILHWEKLFGKQFSGHLFVLEQEEYKVKAVITLFNMITYGVLLTPNTKEPIVYSYNDGYSFDVKRKELLPLHYLLKKQFTLIN